MGTFQSMNPALGIIRFLLLFSLPNCASAGLPADISPLSLSAVCRAGYNQISWSVVPNRTSPAGYRVYRSLSAGGPYTLLCTVKGGSEQTCRDTSVANGVKYYYIARLFDGNDKEGTDSNEASVVGDTVPPSANLSPPIHLSHFSGSGPLYLQGKATDGISGVAEVRTALRRNDTKEWWDGTAWRASGAPLYLKSELERNGISKWKTGLGGVIWSQATSYYIRVAATDNAGFMQDPSDSATVFIDSPAELSLSIAAAPASVAVGQMVNVSVLVANTGGTEANTIQVFPLDTQGTGNVKVIGQSQVARLPALAPGEFATVSWSYSPTSPGTIMFSATALGVDALSGRTVSTIQNASNQVWVRKAANLDVSISQLPANIRQGAPILIRMFVTNAGESDAQVTNLRVFPSHMGALGIISGPEPATPQLIRAGETREFLWRAKAELAGEIKLSGQADGFDESSGLLTTSGQQTAVAMGVAAAPGLVNLSASEESVIVKSKVGLLAEVRDKAGTPVPGVAVAFRVISGKGKVRPDIAVTDENGKAQAELVSGPSAGINTVEARVGAVLSAVSVEGVAPGGTGQGLSRNLFDPTKEPLEIRINVEKKGRLNVTVRTLGGETVTVLADRDSPAGLSVLTWDGKDSTGKPAPNGLYYILIQTGQGTSSRRVSVLAR